MTRERRLGKTDALVWTLSLAAGIGYLVCALQADGNEVFGLYFPLCHLFLFTTVPMCLILCAAFETLPLEWLRKPLRALGACSLEIYLLNVSIFAEVELLRKFICFGPDHRLYYLIMFAVNIALGMGFHFGMEKMSAEKRLQKLISR